MYCEDQPMKHCAIAISAVVALFATGCSNKREICALHSAGLINSPKAAKQLGIDVNTHPNRINNYCQFYKN